MIYNKNKTILLSIIISLFLCSFLIPARVSIAVINETGPSSGAPHPAIDPGSPPSSQPSTTKKGTSYSGGQAIPFKNPIPVKTIPELVEYVSKWLAGIVAGIAVLMIMWAGFKYVTSGGDPGEAKKALGIITNAVKGLIIVFGANIIISEINYLMGITTESGSFFNFANKAVAWGFGIITAVSVLAIVYAGYLFMLKGGTDQKEREKAAKIIQYVAVGLIVTMLAAFIVRFVMGMFE